MKLLKRTLSFCLALTLLSCTVLLKSDSGFAFGNNVRLSAGAAKSGDAAGSSVSTSDGFEKMTPSEQFLSMTSGGEISPVIIIPGISHSELCLVDGEQPDGVARGDNGKAVQHGIFPVDALGTIKSDIPRAIWVLAKVLFTQHSSSYFRKAVKDIFTKLVSPLEMDDTGKLKDENLQLIRFNRLRAEFMNWHEKNPDTPAKEFKSKLSSAEQSLPASYADMNGKDVTLLRRLVTTSYDEAGLEGFEEKVGLDKLYFFTFSLYGDTINAAAELEQFIQGVKKVSGSDKVSFLTVSLGGTVFTAWADLYGAKNNYKDLDKVVNAVAVLDGTNVVGDFFSALAFNKTERSEQYELNPYFNLDDDFLYSQLISTFLDSDSPSKDAILSGLLNSVIRILPRNAVLDLLHEAYDAFSSGIMLSTPQIWAMIPSALYPELSKKLLGDLPLIKEKTDTFYRAQKDLRDNVQSMIKNGVEVSNICGYNCCSGDTDYRYFCAVASAGTTNGDGVINITSTSLGAKCVPVGQRLGYTASGADTDSHSYISPDGSVDASYCALPDNTWFFNKMLHEDANSNSAETNLIIALITAKEPFTVLDYPEYYPQFADSANNKMYRRGAVSDAKALLEGDEELTPEFRAELTKTVERAQLELQSTRCDVDEVEDIKLSFKRLLGQYYDYGRYAIDSDAAIAAAKLADACDKAVMTVVGGQGFSDFVKSFINGKAYLRLLDEIKQAYNSVTSSINQ